MKKNSVKQPAIQFFRGHYYFSVYGDISANQKNVKF